MRRNVLLLLVGLLGFVHASGLLHAADQRPRLMVLTDIGGDPDDQQSLVRLTSRDWIERHVRSTGPLGKLYPTKTWTAPNPEGCMKEGDTPSWFFCLPLGGNDLSDPCQPGWGGQFRQADGGWYRDDRQPARSARETVSRWRPDFQADFARRMAWTRSE